MAQKWWKEAVVYQIYPRSFKDTNGDGIGDIQGIIQKLDYLKDLGIDVIWICPVYQSPMDDNGYDISDYKSILAEFGTMADLEELIDQVHQRGMKLLMDIVMNHTSDEHPWFIESRSSKDNSYRDYYIWRPASQDGGRPNNWESIFSGPAWEWDDQSQEYYLHVFSKKQPDLNWENPKVRRDLQEMTNWWLDKGIDGFRVDAISHIKKAPGLPDMPNPDNKEVVPSFAGHMNQPGINDFLTEFRQATFDHYDIMTVGEANGVAVEDAAEWVGEDHGHFDMIFQFEALDLWGSQAGDFDLRNYKRVMTKWQKGLEGMGWNALYIENHDLVRATSAMGDEGDLREKSAKALATMYFFMQGTPYIYQGQEIGMTNAHFDRLEDYDDIQSVNRAKYMMDHEGAGLEEAMAYMWQNSRDNVRTPMQWDQTMHAGFTSGQPWLKVNENYTNINVASSMSDPDSIYHYYKKMIQVRRASQTLIYGSYELILADHPEVYAYLRQGEEETFLVVVNMFDNPSQVDLSDYQVDFTVLANYPIEEGKQIKQLRPYEARLVRLQNENANWISQH